MKIHFLALAFGLASFAAAAADSPRAQPVAPGGAIAAAKAHAAPAATVMASPVVMETAAVLLPDGRVSIGCERKRNPHPAPVGINRPAAEGPQ